MSLVRVRQALADDAQAMARVRAASIRQLCRDDHGDDPAIITAWIGSADRFVHFLDQPEVTLLVAEIDLQLAGVGGIAGDRVTLNYVDPDYRFRGVSTALLAEAERLLVRNGVRVGRLNSTRAALPFYLSRGWMIDGPAGAEDGQPMRKTLG